VISPLDPLHPDGALGTVVVVGSAAPPWAVPSDGGALDAIVVAPGAREWPDAAAQLERALPRLDADGIVYLLVSPRHRRGALRACRRLGLEQAAELLHLPDVRSSRYVVPFVAGTGEYALANIAPVQPYRRLLVRLALRRRWSRALAAAVLPIGVVLHRRDARPLYAWVTPELTPALPDAAVVVRRGNGREDRVALALFDRNAAGRPARVVKLAPPATSGRRCEAQILADLGAQARAAGADVPAPLATMEIRGRFAFAETALAGRTAAERLARRPRAVAPLLARLAEWLERWHAETAAALPDGAALLEQEVRRPLEVLGGVLERAYRETLLARCDALAGAPVTAVAAHGDLTMFNVLWDGDGALAILDWEEARPRALPLVDLAYAAVDAVAAASRYRDRVAAFESVYRQKTLERFAGRVAMRLELQPDVAELAVHACWLQHAANELRELGGAGGPFVQIARRLAGR